MRWRNGCDPKRPRCSGTSRLLTSVTALRRPASLPPPDPAQPKSSAPVYCTTSGSLKADCPRWAVRLPPWLIWWVCRCRRASGDTATTGLSAPPRCGRSGPNPSSLSLPNAIQLDHLTVSMQMTGRCCWWPMTIDVAFGLTPVRACVVLPWPNKSTRAVAACGVRCDTADDRAPGGHLASNNVATT